MIRIAMLIATLTVSSCQTTGLASSGLCDSGSCRQAMSQHLMSSRERVVAGPGLSWCRISGEGRERFTPATEVVVDTRDSGSTDGVERFVPAVAVNASLYFFNSSNEAGSRAIETMTKWATERGHSQHVSRFQGSSAYWPSYAVLTTTLSSLFLLDSHPDLTAEKRETILQWTQGIMEDARIFSQLPSGWAGYQDQEQRVNNHNGRRALVLLLYGMHTENHALIRKSLSDIERSFGAIDENNVPFDANRGDWALNYVNYALDTMTTFNSFISVVDPQFSERRPELRSKLDGAMRFLFEEVESPNLIHEYASQNIGRPADAYGGVQDVWFTAYDWPTGVPWAWVDTSYAKTLTSGRAAMISTMADNPGLRRAKYSDTAGNVSCMFF